MMKWISFLLFLGCMLSGGLSLVSYSQEAGVAPAATIPEVTIPYETTCPAGSEYLEGAIAKLKEQVCVPDSNKATPDNAQQLVSNDPIKQLERQCIFNAMNIFDHKPVPNKLLPHKPGAKPGTKAYSQPYCSRHYQYLTCPSSTYIGPECDQSQTTRPCISENYVDVIHQSVTNAARCVFNNSSINMEEMFPMLAQESGFHVNVVSPSGCRGMGQFSQGAALDIDAIDHNAKTGTGIATRSELLNNTEACSAPEIKNELSQQPQDHTKYLIKCEVLHVPENPTRNLLYSFRYYRYLKDNFTTKLAVNPNIDKLKKWGLTKSDIELLTTRITRASYNGGGSISNKFSVFMSTKEVTSQLNGQGSLDSLWAKFKTFLRIKHVSNEAIEYADDVETRKSDVEKKGAGKCFSGK